MGLVVLGLAVGLFVRTCLGLAGASLATFAVAFAALATGILVAVLVGSAEPFVPFASRVERWVAANVLRRLLFGIVRQSFAR